MKRAGMIFAGLGALATIISGFYLHPAMGWFILGTWFLLGSYSIFEVTREREKKHDPERPN